LLGVIGDEKNMSAVNKSGAVPNAFGHIAAIDNSSIAQAALYLASPNYYKPVSYQPKDYLSAEYNRSPTAFYETVFREIWLSEPKGNADWWSRIKFAMGSKTHAATTTSTAKTAAMTSTAARVTITCRAARATTFICSISAAVRTQSPTAKA
jgi:hypothetical protein